MTNEKLPENEYLLIAKNFMEDIVVDKTKEIFKMREDICKCNKCFSDVCALAFNSLSPIYGTRGVGESYARANEPLMIQVTVEIARGIELVKLNPRH